MSKLTLIGQAKRDLYFIDGEKRHLFMKKGDIKNLYGKSAGIYGYKDLEYSSENFRFLVPLEEVKTLIVRVIKSESDAFNGSDRQEDITDYANELIAKVEDL